MQGGYRGTSPRYSTMFKPINADDDLTHNNNMGISTRGLFKLKKWTLAIQSISVGEHSVKLTLPDYDALRVIVHRENVNQSEYTYQLKKNDNKFTLLKKVRE